MFSPHSHRPRRPPRNPSSGTGGWSVAIDGSYTPGVAAPEENVVEGNVIGTASLERFAPGWADLAPGVAAAVRSLREINDYCMFDTLDTYFVFLRTRIATGTDHVDGEELL